MTDSNEGRKKILVIDDEPSVVIYLETLLQDNGYNTISASNGNDGMEKALEHHPDLICLDITMPEKSGVSFYRDIRKNEETKDIPVVIVTAVTYYGGDPEPFKNFLSSRHIVPAPDAFFPKPIDKKEFISKINELLA